METRPIVLVFPRCEPDWPDPAKRLGFPLAILTLARALIGAGFRVRLIDENVIARFDREYSSVERPLWVGISCLGGGQIDAGLEVARVVRSRHPDVKIVWGGWNPTLLPHLYEDPGLRSLVDVVARGRGESTAVAISRRLSEGRDLAGIRGISWRNDAGELHRETDVDDAPLEVAPLPWSLIEHPDRYLWRFGVANYLSSYGCPHRCTFCGIPVGSPTFRPTDNAVVVDHVRELIARGANSIVFYDDNFFTSRTRVVDLARRFADAGLSLKWFSNGRVDQVSRLTDDELDLLARSGCSGLNVGYETGDADTADRVKKDLDVGVTRELARRLHAAGIGLSINFMVGLPGESEASLAVSLSTLFELHAAHPGIEVCWYMFMPSPGTEAWRDLVAAGLLTEPRTLREHARLQYLYLEHPWYYASPPSDVFHEHRSRLKAIAWWFWIGWASPIPRGMIGRGLRAFARWRFRGRRFAYPLDWRIAYAWNRLRSTGRIAAARRRFLRGELPRDVDGSVPPRQSDAGKSVERWARGAI